MTEKVSKITSELSIIRLTLTKKKNDESTYELSSSSTTTWSYLFSEARNIKIMQIRGIG